MGLLLRLIGTSAFEPILAILEARGTARKRRRRPKRIVLIRHGESVDNVNSDMYQSVPDSQIPLTSRGYRQGKAAGEMLRTLTGDETIRFFHSPYLRTRQTLLAMLTAFQGKEVQLTSEPRLREQDFGLRTPSFRYHAAAPLDRAN